jgi:hypothetical protein
MLEFETFYEGQDISVDPAKVSCVWDRGIEDNANGYNGPHCFLICDGYAMLDVRGTYADVKDALFPPTP